MFVIDVAFELQNALMSALAYIRIQYEDNVGEPRVIWLRRAPEHAREVYDDRRDTWSVQSRRSPDPTSTFIRQLRIGFRVDRKLGSEVTISMTLKRRRC